MFKLNLPEYNFRIKKENNQTKIFDLIRKKFVVLTPEEWVRQNFIMFMLKENNFPQSLVAVEKELELNKLKKRTDIVFFNRDAKAMIIVECKAPGIEISQNTFEQIAIYNIKLCVDYLIVTNGINHYCCKMDYQARTYKFIETIPTFNEINK